MKDRNWISGQINISALLAFVFGVFFLFVLLIFVVTFTELTPTAKQVFITVLSIAAAGVGAVIPGLLKIKMPYAEASGALAVFLLVYLNEPAINETVEKFISPPPHSADQIVGAYLERIDQRELDGAWSLLDQETKGFMVQSQESFNDLYTGALSLLGRAVSRTEVGEAGMSVSEGYPPGAYRKISFLTRFENGACHGEDVVVRARDKNADWSVFSHQVSMLPVPCP